MPQIHLVERVPTVRKIDKDKNEWESGLWAVSEESAQKLIGGRLFLHAGKQQPSHFGGEILSYRVEGTGEKAGYVVFRVFAAVDAKGIKVARTGWSNDTKIIWDTPAS